MITIMFAEAGKAANATMVVANESDDGLAMSIETKPASSGPQHNSSSDHLEAKNSSTGT